jgi:group I intron endonuclease
VEYIVYKVTNQINGYIYIGITNNFQQRIREHKSCANSNKYKYQSRFYNAIRKYGFENFKFEILETVENRKKLEEREIYWIKYYNSTDKKVGYNITKGGTGGKTHDISGKNNPMYGRRYTEEEKRRIGEYSKGRKASEETRKKISEALKGKQKTEEHRKNLSKSNKGHLPPNKKEITVINIYTKEIITFVSETQMERELNCSRKTINSGRVSKNGYKKYDFEKGLETIESIA